MKLLAAGGMFAGMALLGLLAGVVLEARMGQPLWVPGLLLTGLVLGGYSAARMLMSEVR